MFGAGCGEVFCGAVSRPSMCRARGGVNCCGGVVKSCCCGGVKGLDGGVKGRDGGVKGRGGGVKGRGGVGLTGVKFALSRSCCCS